MALTTITVTGSYPAGAGSQLATGWVQFVPTARIVNATGHTIIPQTPIQVQLQLGGFSLTNVATTDNAGLEPSGWAWQVTENITGIPTVTYTVDIPSSYGATVDLAQLSPVTPAPTGDSFVQLGGDLGGTSAVPLVEKIQGTTIGAPPGGTTEFLRGDGSWDVPAGAVTSVFGRTGVVVAVSGDYTAAEITGLGSAALVSTSAFDAAGSAATAQSNAEAFTTSSVTTETNRAEGVEATLVVKETLTYYAKDYGILWNGSHDDSSALTSLIATVNTAGGGTILLPAGTGMLQNVVLLSQVIIQGMGYGATVCQLVAGSTGRVFVGQDFVALKGTTSTGGIYQWGLRDMAIDGNFANCPNGGNAVAAFGYDFTLANLRIRNTGAGDYGCYFDYGSYGVSNNPDSTECFLDNVEIHNTNSSSYGGMFWNIHDSMLSRMVVANCAGISVTFGPGASGTQCASHHYWGTTATTHLSINPTAGSIQMTGCQIEGATSVQVIAQASEFSYVGGKIFDPASGNASRGLQIGTSGNEPGGFRVDTIFDGLNGGAVDFTYDTGDNWITGRVYNANADVCYVGTPSVKSYVNLIGDGATLQGIAQWGTQQQPTDLITNSGSGVIGVETFSRYYIGGTSNGLTSGYLFLTYFTPGNSYTASNFGCATGTAMSGGTLAQYGLYSVAANGNLTLVARSSAASVTAFSASGSNTSVFDSTLVSSYTLLRGQRYAIGLIQIGAGTVPTIKGNQISQVLQIAPVICEQLTGQSGMPTSILASSFTGNIAAINWSYVF